MWLIAMFLSANLLSVGNGWVVWHEKQFVPMLCAKVSMVELAKVIDPIEFAKRSKPGSSGVCELSSQTLPIRL